ncbi:MAG: hypothetical protein Q8Q74_08110 [Polaromonas sp.]|uniref:hypothetical protein n=1 Tax=Polaromonas sp. TaxID=1869339 RepID=UPI00273011F1|nr:hypothetical protein [Polaromonas sp.]MDP2449611.1 hypothetical protein [Polaromonas sp.]MDP3826499.1 hypothetical protein [Polaromonas sp.]
MANDSSANNAQPVADQLSPQRRQAMVDVFGEAFANSYRGPIHFMDGELLSSPTAMTFYRRDFGYISKVLAYEYQYRSWHGYNQELLDRYAEIVTKKLTSMATLLENWSNRFEKVMQQNGTKMESTVYPNGIVATVPVISGFARRYFATLKELDRFNLLAGTANLMGVIDSTQRAQAEYMCKNAVRAFAAALRNEVVRLYREADRMMQEQRHKGSSSPEQAAQVEAQGQELQAFASSMEADGKTDSALNMGDADPSKVLDDAVAASSAATKSASKARKPKQDPAPAAPADSSAVEEQPVAAA